MTSNNPHTPPTTSASDIGYSTVKGLIGAIPLAGALASELMTYVVNPPLQQRQLDWMTSVAESLHKLESESKLDIGALKDNPIFITTLMQASQTAVRNHQKDKLNALRNAVLNSALPGAPDDAVQFLYVRFVDNFTEWHIKVLKFFDDPVVWYNNSGRQMPNFTHAGLVHIVQDAFPTLHGKSEFFPIIWRELITNGLVEGNIEITISGTGLTARRTTDFGKRFLQFISDPKP